MLSAKHSLLACAIAAAIAGIQAAPAHAEVKKFVYLCGGDQNGVRMCPNYQLVLKGPDGWQVDKAASEKNKVQMIVPKGTTFGDAPALIYVKVSLRRKDEPIDKFIEMSHVRWKESVPDAKITRLGETERTNGKAAFVTYRFDNPSRPQQTAEIVSYGFDADNDGNEFVLMVVMTGREKKALDQADKPYKALLRAH